MSKTSKKYVVKAMCSYTDQQGNVKTYYRIIGTGRPTQDGKGLMLNLDATPISGRAIVALDDRPPRAQGGQGNAQSGYNQQPPPVADDDVPF